METETLLIWGIGLFLFISATLPVLRHKRKLERQADEAEAEALRFGLDEPATLHPVVDPTRCISTGACVNVCPEGGVLGLRHGQAVPIMPACCIGHGLCERACPMGAIQLVFGTEKRGVDIPRISENFETNVPGMYVIGELGGMGLICNAFEQGRRCIEGIAREARAGASDAVDVLIVGCGPAGLSASINCVNHGLSYVTIEKEDIGGTVRHYPRKKLVMTQPWKVPGYGKLSFREIVKEDLIELWTEIVARTGVRVRTEETVTDVSRGIDGCFEVQTSRTSHRAKRVILAIGRRGVPRKLGVEGEDLPKVAYSLREPETFRENRVLVVGGGDSAIEAALSLCEQPGTEVAISYRRDQFSRIKPANRDRIAKALGQARLDVLWSTRVLQIEPDSVTYANGGDPHRLANDYVFVFIGGELPTAFLERCGIVIDTKFGQP